MPRPSTKTEAEKAQAAAAKREKFKELAANRLDKAILALNNLQKLSSYKPSETQRDYIIGELSKKAQQIHAAFSGTKTSNATVEIPD